MGAFGLAKPDPLVQAGVCENTEPGLQAGLKSLDKGGEEPSLIFSHDVKRF